MLTTIQSPGLPVLDTRTETLDLHKRFFKQQTARGDYVFVHEHLGDLVEIAIMPVDGVPILRYSQMNAMLEAALEKEYPGWEPMHPETKPDWRRLDEENWPREVEKLFIKLLDWHTAHGMTSQTYEQGQKAAQAVVDRLVEEELAGRSVPSPEQMESAWTEQNGPRLPTVPPALPKRKEESENGTH